MAGPGAPSPPWLRLTSQRLCQSSLGPHAPGRVQPSERSRKMGEITTLSRSTGRSTRRSRSIRSLPRWPRCSPTTAPGGPLVPPLRAVGARQAGAGRAPTGVPDAPTKRSTTSAECRRGAEGVSPRARHRSGTHAFPEIGHPESDLGVRRAMPSTSPASRAGSRRRWRSRATAPRGCGRSWRGRRGRAPGEGEAEPQRARGG